MMIKEVYSVSDEPIPMRRSTNEPIKFPPPQTFDQRIRRNIYRILYHVLRSQEHTDIETMSYQEFVAFCERVIAEGEA